MSILVVFIIAVSLSMDAFSLSLAYGTLNLEKKYMNLLSIIVGIYHFFMPLIGLCVGSTVLSIIKINPNIIVFLVLVFIGIQMIIDSFKSDKLIKLVKLKDLLLFGFAVSIDSFSVGIGLNTITDNYLLSVTMFSLSSFTFTYIGLLLGKKISEIIGKLATIIGGIVLIVIGIIYVI